MSSVKLTLNKETLRQLTTFESDLVAGGINKNTYSGCLSEADNQVCGGRCSVGQLTICVCSA